MESECPVVVLKPSSPKDGTEKLIGDSDLSKSDVSKDETKSELGVKKIANMMKELKLKLNPMAEEFIPSCYYFYGSFGGYELVLFDQNFGNGGFMNRRRRNRYNQNKRMLNSRAFKAYKEDSIRRTVYVSDFGHDITEERLATLFSSYGHVVDCRVCESPHTRLRFAFVEFADKHSANAALSLSGTLVDFSPIKVLPSKTPILPVNPKFLPRSDYELEMCARTVYCTNIDHKVSQADIKKFFETKCGEVSQLRLLDQRMHFSRMAFVEFVKVESAIKALDLSGENLGFQRIRVTPSKTPVRPQFPQL